MTGLPTRKAEAWRYADLKAAEALWPPPPARLISVPRQEGRADVVRVREAGIHDVRVELAEGARLNLVVVADAAGYARVTVEARLARGAELDLGGVLLGTGEATVELVTDIRHAEPDAVSRQRVRLVADGQATVNYLGRIAVARDAQRTDAEQSAKALVLKRTAAANLKPELEIFADDVKCAHGCTVGELDRTALFYLQSRGVPRAEAERLLTTAFVADALAGVADEAVREELEAETRAWLEARA